MCWRQVLCKHSSLRAAQLVCESRGCPISADSHARQHQPHLRNQTCIFHGVNGRILCTRICTPQVVWKGEAHGYGGVSAQVQQGVQQHGAMTGGQHESVAVEPEGVGGVVMHELVEEQVANGRASHGHARMAGVGLVDGIDRQETDGVDGDINVLLAGLHHALLLRVMLDGSDRVDLRQHKG